MSMPCLGYELVSKKDIEHDCPSTHLSIFNRESRRGGMIVFPIIFYFW